LRVAVYDLLDHGCSCVVQGRRENTRCNQHGSEQPAKGMILIPYPWRVDRMNHTGMSQQDHSLYQRIAAGETEAIEQLVHNYSAWIQVMICRMLKQSGSVRTIDMRDVEELASDVLYTVYHEIRKFDPARAQFSTWIAMKTLYLVRDFLRKQRRERQHLARVSEDVTIAHREQLTAQAANGFRAYEEQSLLQQFTAVVVQLPESSQEILTLYVQEGKSYLEIAEITGKPKGTVKSTLHRIQKQLKTAVVESDGAADDDTSESTP
jgi:RNA polymerase sigma-70 factor (ECF subfamily)